MNFLDENGLGRLWAQIILKLNSKVPDGGTTGQVLTKTADGQKWQSMSKNNVGLGNVDNVKQYSANNPPPYPVTSVNGKTGTITVHEVPAVTTSDNGKFLCVVNGAWAAVAYPSAENSTF